MSKIECSVCDFASLAFDNFLDLSLPFPKAAVSYTSQTTLERCLEAFTKTETLDGPEKYYCSKCKKQ